MRSNSGSSKIVRKESAQAALARSGRGTRAGGTGSRRRVSGPPPAEGAKRPDLGTLIRKDGDPAPSGGPGGILLPPPPPERA